MGKKYIIEIPEDKIADFVGSTHFLMPYMMAGHIGHHDTGLPIEPYTEPDLERVRKEAYEDGYKTAKVQCNIQVEKDLREVGKRHYQKGSSDAWEAARKIEFGTGNGGISTNIMEEIFGTPIPNRVLRDFAASEAIEKLKAYEREQDSEIKVGDEVVSEDDIKAVVIDMDDYLLHVLDENGLIQGWPREDVVKTDRHFPDIAAVLKRMRGEQDE